MIHKVCGPISFSFQRIIAHDAANDLALIKVETHPTAFASLRSGVRLGEGVALLDSRVCWLQVVTSPSATSPPWPGWETTRASYNFRRPCSGLGWREPVSDRRFLAFRSVRGGFWAPVSGRHFPISNSACCRPVRLLTETGRSAFYHFWGEPKGHLHRAAIFDAMGIGNDVTFG